MSSLDAFTNRFSETATPFLIELPHGAKQKVGQGESQFRMTLRNKRGIRALLTRDEATIIRAYLRGDIEFDGDMIKVFTLMRAALQDRHLLGLPWHFIRHFVSGQIWTNERAIALPHANANLLLRFLDPVMPAYAQGAYAVDEEPLDKALERKFDLVITKCEIGPGKKVLEIEPGWGTFAAYALKAGANFTGITISAVSESALKSKFGNIGDRFKILVSDLLTYDTDEQFDAVVAMGTLQHPTLNKRVLKKFSQLLKPGGRLFLEEAMVLSPYEALASMSRLLTRPHAIGKLLEPIREV